MSSRPTWIAMRFGQLRRFNLGRRRADHRAAHADLDLLDVGVLALPAGHDPVGIVRLDPALEEARRHRQMRGVDLDALQIHAGEPTLENILADFGAELFFHSQPTFLIRAGHFLFSEGRVVAAELGETDSGDSAGAVTRGYITEAESWWLGGGWFPRAVGEGRRRAGSAAGRHRSTVPGGVFCRAQFSYF